MWKWLLSAVFCVRFIFATTESEIRIRDFTDNLIQCDYLIITPQEFLNQAYRLAQHRNSFANDDVQYARVAVLEDIYAFESALKPHESIWNLLKIANTDWLYPPKYIVLFGDDRLAWSVSSEAPVSTGMMPTFLNGYYVIYHGSKLDTVFNFSDDYYLNLSQNSAGEVKASAYDLNISIGRIPCETLSQCEIYISKLIEFDIAPQESRGWRNNVLIMADDVVQDTVADPLYFMHFNGAEKLSSHPAFHGSQIFKVYLSAFKRIPHTRHSDALGAALEIYSQGALWSLYLGHGSAYRLSDETFMTGSDIATFSNNKTPFIMVSLSCQNGSFHLPFDYAMCKQFLFSANGALAYIASTVLEYVSPNEKFINTLFRLVDSLPSPSLGNAVRVAKRECAVYNLKGYHLLGDPALRIASAPLPVDLSVQNYHGAQTTVTCRSQIPVSGRYRLTLSQPDTIKLIDDTLRFFVIDSILFQEENDFVNQLSYVLDNTVSGPLKLTAFLWGNNFQTTIDTVLFVDGTPVMAETEKPGGNGIIVSLRNRNVSINIPGFLQNKTEVYISDLNGRKLADIPVHSTSSVQIDLENIKIASGMYILTVVANDGSARVRRIFSKLR